MAAVHSTEAPAVPYLSPKPVTQSDATLGDLIGFYFRDVGQLQTIGESHGFTLRRIQRTAIAGKVAKDLTSGDFIDYCRQRIAGGVCPATVMQDVTYIRGPLKLAKIMWGVPATTAPIDEAMPLLKKLHLVGKSVPRERRPSLEELHRLVEYFMQRERHGKVKIPMSLITLFQVESGRRISETCRLRWEDLNEQDRTILVRDLKDPKRKKGTGNHAEAALLGNSFAIIQAMPRIPGEPRIFPYNKSSCVQAYIAAKKRLGIENLHLHDNRRECASRMIEEGFSVPETMLVTLHKNQAVLVRTYMKLKPADLHKGPAAKRGKRALKELAASTLLYTEGSGDARVLRAAPEERPIAPKPRLRGPVALVA